MKAELLSAKSSEKSSSSPLGSASSNSIGRYSLGPYKFSGMSPQGSKERRRSAGDQEMVKQLNMFVRTRTDSGKRLTDMVREDNVDGYNIVKLKHVLQLYNIFIKKHLYAIFIFLLYFIIICSSTVYFYRKSWNK